MEIVSALPELRDDKPPPPSSAPGSLDAKHLDEKFDASAERIDVERFDIEPADADDTDSKAPIITDGLDVSRYVVDPRDDGGASITLRSVVVGTLMAGLGAALQQRYIFKPIETNISGVFLLLVVYSLGTAWAAVLPRKELVEGTRFEALAPVLHFVNPCDFGIKEHVVATVMASTAAYGSTAVTNFAVQRLFYDTNVHATTAVLATFSTACFGYGIVGLLRPLTVYPAEMVYWIQMPTVSVFQALHFDSVRNAKRVRLFWIVFAALFVYEIIPAYIFPLLNGFSIICLATQGAPASALDVITNIFGGAEGNEGLGLLNLSFDWQYIGSTYMSLPLAQQANTWVGYAICYVAIAGIYYSNAWNAQSFPMLSTSLFSANGSKYDQSAVFTSPSFEVNQTAIDVYGLPYLTGSNAWHNLVANLAIGGLVTHCVCFWGPYVRDSFRHARDKTYPDPHWQAMRKYKEAPHWWYILLLLLAFFAGLIVVLKGETTLPWWSYIISLAVGFFITPFSTLLYGRMGSAVSTNQLSKMVAGAVNPGKPVANLYFSMWSHDVVSTSIGMAQDLKLGQYTKIPPRVMFGVQMYGTILGAIINYAVMVSVVTAQREILLDPAGTNVWSGQTVQALNSNAVTWALARELYGPGRQYFLVPMAIFIGAIPTLTQWLVSLRWPNFKIGLVDMKSIILPLVWNYAGYMYAGVTSVYTTTILVGVVSQFWWRRYHPRSYRKYNYILGGAMDGGAQIMIFVLSFAVFGAAGVTRPFPSWAGNPAKGNADYCNGNGALD